MGQGEVKLNVPIDWLAVLCISSAPPFTCRAPPGSSVRDGKCRRYNGNSTSVQYSHSCRSSHRCLVVAWVWDPGVQ